MKGVMWKFAWRPFRIAILFGKRSFAPLYEPFTSAVCTYKMPQSFHQCTSEVDERQDDGYPAC